MGQNVRLETKIPNLNLNGSMIHILILKKDSIFENSNLIGEEKMKLQLIKDIGESCHVFLKLQIEMI